MKKSVGTNWKRRALRKIIIDSSKMFCKSIRSLNKVPPIRNGVVVDIFLSENGYFQKFFRVDCKLSQFILIK
jgi:hypothetical protein